MTWLFELDSKFKEAMERLARESCKGIREMIGEKVCFDLLISVKIIGNIRIISYKIKKDLEH